VFATTCQEKMVFIRAACLGLAVVEVSAQDFGAQAQMPDVQTMYQQMPDTQIPYQQMPDMQMQFPPLGNTQPGFPGTFDFQGMPGMPVHQVMPEFQLPDFQQMPPPVPEAPEPVRPDDGSESCQQKQAENPLHINMTPLTVGSVYCSQAADQRWWDVTVKEMNCDGSYAVVVNDDVKTEWPMAQRAYFLDKSCDKFYRDALTEEGLSPEEIEFSLQQEGMIPVPETEAQAPETEPAEPAEPAETSHHQPVETSMPAEEAAPPAKPSRWPVLSDKKTPWKVVAGAAAAGAVPLIYGLTGS